MRSLLAVALPVLAAAGSVEMGDRYLVPDRSEYFLRESSDSVNHFFKLEIQGYAMREWEYGPPPTDSLILNFTIPNARGDILLNGQRILSMPFPPPNIEAVPIEALPVPTDISREELEVLFAMPPAILRERSAYWKYKHYQVGYSLTHMKVDEGASTVLQLDVKSLYRRNPDKDFELDEPNQKIVELHINPVSLPNTGAVGMTLSRAQLVTREEKQKPFKMRCGREAKWVVERDPREWDKFGKLGTWSRTLHIWWDQQVVPLAAFGFILCLIGLVRFAMVKHAQNHEDDIEAAALLQDDIDDFLENEPPAYLGFLPALPGIAEEKDRTEDK